jgi:hypothetical protein
MRVVRDGLADHGDGGNIQFAGEMHLSKRLQSVAITVVAQLALAEMKKYLNLDK